MKPTSKHADVSIIIATVGKRIDKLHHCLQSIKAGSRQPVEVIVVQQCNTTIPLPRWVKSIHAEPKGHSFAKNIGAQNAKASCIAFIDDDCVVDRDWVCEVEKIFANPSIAAITGSVIPYQQTKVAGMFCPSQFHRPKKEITNQFSLDKIIFGIGANQIFRKHIFITQHGFKTWLGLGSVGMAAEDTELIFRLFQHQMTICYSPKVVVFHDRWMEPAACYKLWPTYEGGMISGYTYHALHGATWATRVIKTTWKKKLRELTNISTMTDLLGYLRYIVYYMRGMIVGGYFALINR